MAHVHRVHPPRAPPEQHVGESAGARAEVERDPALDAELVGLQRREQLEAAPRDVVMAPASNPNRDVGVDAGPGLVNPRLADDDGAGEDQGTGSLEVRGETPRDEQLIEARSRSGPTRVGHRSRSRTAVASAVSASGLGSSLAAAWALAQTSAARPERASGLANCR